MISIAIVGAGAWGKNHIRVFSEIPNVRLKYVCDQDPSKLHALQKTYPQTKMVEDLKPILQDSEVRGVVVASSALSHYSLSREIMLADKDVLVEKPMALNTRDAEEMLEISEKRKRILMVGHLLIYHPVVDRLKEMVVSGELGKFTISILNGLISGSFGRMKMRFSRLLPTICPSSSTSSTKNR